MCCCERPNRNGEPGYSWDGKTKGVYPVNAPELNDRDVLLFDEPGRCGGMDSHSFHYRLVRNCGLELLVRHGGGDERLRVSLPRSPGEPRTSACRGTDMVEQLRALDSDARYWLLGAIYHAYSNGERKGIEAEASRWRHAAAEKRIKVRKLRNQQGISVKIEPKVIA